MSTPIHQMSLRRAAVASFLSMYVVDLVSTAMVIFESRYLWLEAGVCDVLGYIANLICSVLALDSILKDGWRTKRSLVLIGAVTLANFIGTANGVMLVKHLTKQ